jgi:hypothetical protein
MQESEMERLRCSLFFTFNLRIEIEGEEQQQVDDEEEDAEDVKNCSTNYASCLRVVPQSHKEFIFFSFLNLLFERIVFHMT